MIKKFLFLLCAGMQFCSYAQKKIPSFGTVSVDELQLQACSFERDAPAMKLFDCQEIVLEAASNGWHRLVTERRVRIKIFKEVGFSQASINLPYYNKNKSTKIKDLSGVVYNLEANGTITTQKLEKKDFFKGKAEETISVINFTFPNLKPGSVVEFRYKKIERNMYQVDPWILQSEVPTAYASTVLTTPGYVQVKEKIFGTDTIPNTLEIIPHAGAYNEQRRLYYKENIRAFKPEAFMTSYTDNLMKMVFMVVPQRSFFSEVLMMSRTMWNTTGSLLQASPYFGAQIRSQIPGTEALIDSARRLPSATEKINFIYERTKKQFAGREDQTVYPNSIAEAWRNHSGNSADINLALLNLLQKAGVKAYPLLVSTREHGLIAVDFPSFAQINGVDVVALDSNKVYVMDAYLKFHSYKTPPFNVLNRKAFLLDSGNMRWVAIPADDMPAQDNIAVLSELNTEGVVHGTASMQSLNYARASALDSSDAEAEETKKDKKQTGLTINSVKKENVAIDSLPLVQNLDFTYELEHTDSFYFMNPLFLLRQQQNPFMAAERNTDIDFGCNQTISLQLHVNVPPDYSVESLPKPVQMRSSDTTMVFSRSTFTEGGAVVLRQSFQIKRTLYGKEEYEGVKLFFSKMYALMAEEIVLKKTR